MGTEQGWGELGAVVTVSMATEEPRLCQGRPCLLTCFHPLITRHQEKAWAGRLLPQCCCPPLSVSSSPHAGPPLLPDYICPPSLHLCLSLRFSAPLFVCPSLLFVPLPYLFILLYLFLSVFSFSSALSVSCLFFFFPISLSFSPCPSFPLSFHSFLFVSLYAFLLLSLPLSPPSPLTCAHRNGL